jgi:hypothetical protein
MTPNCTYCDPNASRAYGRRFGKTEMRLEAMKRHLTECMGGEKYERPKCDHGPGLMCWKCVPEEPDDA